jgi:hypothetical protein
MSILTPSTTPTERQVWPRLPKPGKSKVVRVPREQRTPVTLDEVAVGDTLSFLAEDRDRRNIERVGEVIGVRPGQVAHVQTDRGRFGLTRLNWERRAPRR